MLTFGKNKIPSHCEVEVDREPLLNGHDLWEGNDVHAHVDGPRDALLDVAGGNLGNHLSQYFL